MFEIGNTLREARLRRGLDILDCEAETKIRAKYLRAMEEEQFDLMPSPTYVRGFLRTYADFLDLDGQLVLDEYESRFGGYDTPFDPHGRPSRPGRPGRQAEPRRPASTGRRRPPRRRRTEVQLLWLAIGGVMSVALLVWLGVGESDSSAPLTDAPAAVSSAPAPPVVAEPDTASEEAPVRPKLTRIVLEGTGVNGCWVQVSGRSGIVFEETLEPGQAKEFRVREGIRVRAANPGELVVTVAGKPVELPGSATGTWRITAAGARSVG